MIRECAEGEVELFGRKSIILWNSDLKECIMYTEESNHWERLSFRPPQLNEMKVGLHNWLILK